MGVPFTLSRGSQYRARPRLRTNYASYSSTSYAPTIFVLIRSFERPKVYVSVPMTPASVQCLTRPTSTSPTNGRNTSRRNVTATPQQTRHGDNQCDGWTCLRARLSYSSPLTARIGVESLRLSHYHLLASFCPFNPPASLTPYLYGGRRRRRGRCRGRPPAARRTGRCPDRPPSRCGSSTCGPPPPSAPATPTHSLDSLKPYV